MKVHDPRRAWTKEENLAADIRDTMLECWRGGHVIRPPEVVDSYLAKQKAMKASKLIKEQQWEEV